MEQYLGEIRMFAGNFAPEGWLFCNGQIMSISNNRALYTLIGTAYGGDGKTTFALPNMQGRLPLHQGKNPITGTNFAIGSIGGAETVTLMAEQMPQHTHMVACSSEPGESAGPENAFWAKKNVQYASSNPTGAMNAKAITHTGGGRPHDNMMPFLAVSFIIATQGEYVPKG